MQKMIRDNLVQSLLLNTTSYWTEDNGWKNETSYRTEENIDLQLLYKVNL